MVMPSLLALDEDIDAFALDVDEAAELFTVLSVELFAPELATELAATELAGALLEDLLSEEPPQAPNIRLVPSSMPSESDRVCAFNAHKRGVVIVLTSFVIVIVSVLLAVIVGIDRGLQVRLAAFVIGGASLAKAPQALAIFTCRERAVVRVTVIRTPEIVLPF
jgi:hypothetical protein